MAKPVTMANYPHGVEVVTGKTHLEAGKPYKLEVDYQKTANTTVNAPPHLKLVWSRIDRSVDPAVTAAAQKADVVVAVVGITSELEGEEMKNVTSPASRAGTAPASICRSPSKNCSQTLAATGKPLVVVLTNGSALAVNWANEHANAILDAWYPGEEGGTAVAQTLSGKNNPAGRLPVTFYKGVDQLPPFEDYNMKGRTYRYFTGTPLYPFGYGLSYTKFAYSNLSVPTAAVDAGQPGRC